MVENNGLEGMTRREFLRLAAFAGAATALGMPSLAEAKQLEEITEHNFEEKVYRNPKPVIVLFGEAERDLKNDGSIAYSKRMQKVVEALADRYLQIDFYTVFFDHDPPQGSKKWKRIFGVEDTSPTTVMYARHDVLTGKRFDRNVKIDVLRGGPVNDKWISSWTYGNSSASDWIESNLIFPNKGYVIRLNNSSDPRKIEIVSR